MSSGSSETGRSSGCRGDKVNDYLTIDCSGCDGPQDLGQLRCLRGCARTVSEAGEIDHIALLRDVVVEYRGRSVAALQKMSAPLAISRTIGKIASRKCSKCPIEPSRVLEQLCADWPPIPPPESFRVPHPQGGSLQCVDCRNRTVAAMEVVRKDISAISVQMNRMTVRVFGGRR